jgi:hypothetical protein
MPNISVIILITHRCPHVSHRIGLTWSFLLILGGISHSAVDWILISSAVQVLIHNLGAIGDHSAVLYVPYEPVPPGTVENISKEPTVVMLLLDRQR